MHTTPPFSVNELRRLLHYNPDTGVFRWRVKRRGSSSGKCGSINSNGYVRIRIDYQSYAAHALAWAYMTGTYPTLIVDHRDKVRSNNRFENLRLATRVQNSQNANKSKRNTSGYKGVSFNKAARKWTALIRVDKRSKYLGLFTTPEEAHKAYCEASTLYFGEFASH